MTKPMVLGLLVAIALFWAVGAYNRLVRLRSEVVKAYSALDNVLRCTPP
jgi:LemA protein